MGFARCVAADAPGLAQAYGAWNTGPPDFDLPAWTADQALWRIQNEIVFKYTDAGGNVRGYAAAQPILEYGDPADPFGERTPAFRLCWWLIDPTVGALTALQAVVPAVGTWAKNAGQRRLAVWLVKDSPLDKFLRNNLGFRQVSFSVDGQFSILDLLL